MGFGVLHVGFGVGLMGCLAGSVLADVQAVARGALKRSHIVNVGLAMSLTIWEISCKGDLACVTISFLRLRVDTNGCSV